MSLFGEATMGGAFLRRRGIAQPTFQQVRPEDGATRNDEELEAKRAFGGRGINGFNACEGKEDAEQEADNKIDA